ncbi:MAG: lectin like domain-containing protein [Acutalibacteraceae bacterium]
MKTTRKILSLALAFLMVLSLFPSISFKASAADADATGAVLTPQQRFNVATTPSKYGLIYVDTNGELRLSRTDNALKIRKADTVPSSYNSKDLGYITSVRNQGAYGTCWAFAACAASEASLIKNNGYSRTASTTILAPGHLAYWTFASAYDKLGLLTGDKTAILTANTTAYDFGGSSYLAAYTITKGTGPALENDYPYGTYPGSSGKSFTSDQSYQKNAGAQIKNIYWVDYSNREDVKKMIMQYGAGTFGYYVADNDSDYEKSGTYNGEAYTSYAIANGINYDSSTKTYENQYSNHDITVVGWDDNFPAENFASASGVTEDGAWLCKNSWGTSYGASGYYWISYQDFANSGDTAAFFEYETETPYDNIYQYDGTSSVLYYYTDEGGYMGNVFTADSDETLKAVSFFTLDTNVGYTVNVYKNVTSTPTSGTLVSSATVSGTTTYMQYVTVPLNAEVNIDKGEKYSVVVKFDAGKCLPVDCSDTITGYYKFTNATSAGQSYYSSNGTTWTDVSSETYGTESNYSFRVKALTNEREPDPVAVTGVTLDQTSVSIPQSTSVTLTATVAPEDATNKAVTWTSSDDTIATVVDGKVVASNEKTGTVTITATTVDGNYSASCTVTVTEFTGGFLPATKADFKGNDRFMLTVTVDGVVYAMKNVADTTDTSGLIGAVVSGNTTQASKMATAVWTPLKTGVTDNTDASLIWETEANNDGTYMIKSAATGEYLYANSSSNGVSLGTTSANWTITDTADGESVILSIGTSKELYYRKSSAVFKTYASGKTEADYIVPQAYVYEVNPADVTQYTVEANTLDETMGLVSGNGTYDSGTNATVTATAADGYKFVNWTDDDENVVSTDNPYTFMVTGNTVLWATFEEDVVEEPDVPVDGAYVEVTADTTFKAGDKLMIVADNGSLYALNTTAGTSSSNMLKGTEVTATQIANNTDDTLTWVIETVNDDGTFTIKNASTGTYLYSTSSGNGLSLKASSANWTFDSNMVLSVGGSTGRALLLNKSANEFKTYAYSNRTGSSYVVPTLYIFSEGADAPVEPTKYTVTFDITGNGTIDYKGTSYSNGQSVQIYENTSATFTATPASGYLLGSWMDGDANLIEGNTYTFTVTGDTTITAEFVVDTTPVKVANVVATPGSSSIVAGSSVELSCATAGATIYYSINGGASWVEYAGAIVIDSFPTEIMTYATATDYEDSDVSTYIYEEKVVVPPAEGSYVLSTSEAPEDGEYIIAANVGDAGYYSIKSELTSSKYAGEAISVTDNVVDSTDGIYTFSIKSLGNNQYSIYDKTAGKYVTYSSGTNLGLSDTAYAFTIVYNTNGYEIVSVANTSRGILYSTYSNANKFGGYSTNNFGATNYYRISLFKCNSSEPEPAKTYTVSLDVMGNGSVTYNGTSYTGSNNKITVEEGAEVTLTAVPDAHNSFSSWLDEDSNESTETSYTFTASKDIYIIASFEEDPTAMVGASFTGNGTITVNGENADDLISVYVGDTVTFTATPDADSYFVSWVINGTQYDTAEVAYTVTSTGDIDAKATFAFKYNFDGTGSVDGDDVYMLQMYLTGEVDTMDNIAYADVNGDGQVNLLDAYVLYIKINAQASLKGLRGDTISVGGFQKINSIADLNAGDQIIFVYNDLAINNVVDSSGHTEGMSVSYLGDYIVNPDTSYVWVVGIDEEATTYKYSFLSAADSINYLANTGSANKISFSSTASMFNIESYVNNNTAETLYKIYNSAKGLAYRANTYNYFSFYAASNLSVSSKEYFGVKIYKYNSELSFDETDKLTITTAVAEGQEAMGTVTDTLTVFSGGNVTIKATPNANYDFVSWTITGEDGTVITSEDATYSFTNVTQNYTAVASFKIKPICDLEISAIRGTSTVVTQLSVGDVIYFNTKNLIVTTDELTVSYKIGESGEWVEGTSYTVTGEETYPLTVYVKAEAEGYDSVEASATYEQYSVKTGDYGRVITESNITEGSYVIVAEFDGKYYALTSALNSSNKLVAKEITIENGVISVDNSLASSIVTFSNGKTDDNGVSYVLSTDLGIIKVSSSSTNISYGSGSSFYVKADEANEGLYKLVCDSTIAATNYRTLTLSYSDTAQIFGNYSNASNGNYAFSVMLFKYGAEPEGVIPDEPVDEYSAHDFNHDGVVNATDVKLLQQYLTGEAMAEDTLGTLTAAEVVANIEANGDLDNSGSINLLDAYLLNIEVLSL